MVRLAGSEARRRGLGNVHVDVMDAADPDLPGLLEAARDSTGRIRLTQEVRYTLARVD